MLHSALGDSRLWKRQVGALVSAGHEVVTPDLPGWGDSPLPTEAFSFVDAVVEHLPAALVGNSFGGAVALRTALARQELVSRLVVIAAALPTWDWSETMRTYWSAEEAAIDGGDLDLATQVNLDFWVRPEHHEEVGPQQRRALELQSAHEEPEVLWPELAPLESLASPRSSSSEPRTSPTSARSRSTWPSTSRTRSWPSFRTRAISSASTSRTS